MPHFAASHSVTFDGSFQHTEFPPRKKITEHIFGTLPSVHNITIHCSEKGRTHCAVLAVPKVRTETAVVCHQQLTSNSLNLWHSGNLGQICMLNIQILFINIFISCSLNHHIRHYTLYILYLSIWARCVEHRAVKMFFFLSVVCYQADDSCDLCENIIIMSYTPLMHLCFGRDWYLTDLPSQPW